MAELFAATGDGVARITRRGDEWTVALTLQDSGAQCLTLDPHHPGTLFVGSQGKGVWKSGDGGTHWQDMQLPQPDVFSVAVSAADGSVYAGCEPSMLFRSTDGGQSWHELESLQSIPSRPTWSFPPRPWTSHVRWIAPNPHDADLLLVGIELGGLMRSVDGGVSWQDHRPGAQRDVHSLAWHPRTKGRAYEAGGGGAAWSKDGGESWEPADAGRDRNYTWAVAVEPDDPNAWYVSASTGPFAAHGRGNPEARIYAWRDDEWRTLAGGLPEPLPAMPYALVATEGRVFAGLADGQLWKSSDRGESWDACVLEGDALTRLNALAYAAA